jgi:hypothetical protein
MSELAGSITQIWRKVTKHRDRLAFYGLVQQAASRERLQQQNGWGANRVKLLT